MDLEALIRRATDARIDADPHVAALSPAMSAGGLTAPPLRACAFLAQIAHETGGFRHLRELGDARYLARYDGRADLGNTRPGDGARYRGRGYIMLTGRYNYRAAAEALDLPLLMEPERLETPPVAARAAVWWWNARGLNRLADAGPPRFAVLTRAINGGLNGLADRRARYNDLLDGLE